MIFAHEPMEVKMDDGSISHSVCTVFRNGRKSVSIALDNGCGSLTFLSRSDMRLFIDDEEDEDGTSICNEVTETVFPDMWTVSGSLENFQKAWEWLQEEAQGAK